MKEMSVQQLNTNPFNWISQACLVIKCLSATSVLPDISKTAGDSIKTSSKTEKQTYLRRQIEGSHSSHWPFEA
jgi:hypothetical protein